MNTNKTKKAPAGGSGDRQTMPDMPIEGDLKAEVEERMGVSYADQAAIHASGMPGAVNEMGNSSCMSAGNGGGGGGGGGAGMGGDGGGNGGGNGQGGGTPQVRTCATLTVYRRLLNEDPSYARVRDEIENLAGLYAGDQGLAARSGVTTIPVVVHVVWNTAAQNISDAQVASQVDVLNHDYRHTNTDVAHTPAPFLPLTADARVEFALATVDPHGAATG